MTDSEQMILGFDAGAQVRTADRCQTCGNVHAGTEVHPFNDGSLSGADRFVRNEEPTVVAQSFPFDPILRQALMDKGLLTPADLRAAEDKVRMVTGVFQDAIRQGMKPQVWMEERDD